MRVFLDENMPRPLRWVLVGHQVSFVEREGWKGKENGELLNLVAQQFDVLVTSDANIAYQNTLSGLALSIVVLPTNNLTILRANSIALVETLSELAELSAPVLVSIDWKGRRSRRALDVGADEGADLTPVLPFKR